jgi:ESX secretion-associated protein EspG
VTGLAVSTWTISPAALTMLLGDLGLGDVPRPFEPVHPYTTTDERAEFVARTRQELTAAGLVGADGPRPAVVRNLTALTRAPVGVIVMGTLADGPLLARGCWHERGAVLAVWHGAVVRVRELATTPLADAVVGLLPDVTPAGGQSITVPSDGRAVESEPAEFALYDDLDAPSAERAGTPGAPAALANLFSDPVVSCGAFVPFTHGTLLPPVTWFDIAGRRGVRRTFATTTTHRDGSSWTTYVPGGNPRIAAALHQVTDPLLP